MRALRGSSSSSAAPPRPARRSPRPGAAPPRPASPGADRLLRYGASPPSPARPCRRDRLLDPLDCARVRRIAQRHATSDRLERLADDRDRRLEGVGVFLGGMADQLGRFVELIGQPVEFARHRAELGHGVRFGKRPVEPALGSDRPRQPLEAAQAAPGIGEQQHHEQCHQNIDRRRDPDFWRGPVGPPQGRAQEILGRARGDHHPAARADIERRQRGEQLFLAGRVDIARGDRADAGAGFAHPA